MYIYFVKLYLWNYRDFSKFCFEMYAKKISYNFIASLISLVRRVLIKKRKRPQKTACNFNKTLLKDFANLLQTVISRYTFEWLPLNYSGSVIHKTSFVFTSVWNKLFCFDMRIQNSLSQKSLYPSVTLIYAFLFLKIEIWILMLVSKNYWDVSKIIN